MKCPKYIQKALEKRANAACEFIKNDCIIVDWLKKNNLLGEVEDYDILTGCESIVNPGASSNRILRVIENA